MVASVPSEPGSAEPGRAGDEAAELAERLPPLLARGTGWDEPRVEGLRRLSGGASRDTWSLDAVDRAGRRQPLILQRQRSLVVDAWLETAVEARLLEAAREAGVPTAAVLAWSAGSEELGLPYLLFERIEGETIPQRILREERFASARGMLARQYGEALGRIQRIEPAGLGLAFQDPLEYFERVLGGLGEPSPALAFGFRWLRSHRPPAGDPVVVHGDFRNGNGIVAPQRGLRAVIDWELAHLGDPLEDLGWFCIRAWRFGSPLPVGGFGRYDEIIAAYEATSGRKVDRHALRWWQIMGTVRWAVICLMQGATHWQGHRRSLELAVTGRRAAEAEFDLMLLLPREGR
jgi:aminoglycoside phosphotransferase (APT) family kinase protein